MLIPLIKFFGDALAAPLAPGGKPIAPMSPNEIRGAYVLYIGAGALLSALALGPVLLKLNDAATVYVPIAEVAPGLSADSAVLGEAEPLRGPQAA